MGDKNPKKVPKKKDSNATAKPSATSSVGATKKKK